MAKRIKAYANGEYTIQFTCVPGTTTFVETKNKTDHIFLTIFGIEYKPKLPNTLIRYKTDKAAETVAKEYIRTYPDKLTGYQIVKVSDLPWLFVWNEKLHQYVPKKTKKPQKCDTDELPLSLQFRR